jgi:hypothetical protein
MHDMKINSFLKYRRYSPDWIKSVYDQIGIWWGSDPEISSKDRQRALTTHRLCGPGSMKKHGDLGEMYRSSGMVLRGEKHRLKFGTE